MQEISPNIFLDTNALWMVTGVIRTEEGSVLVDSPMRQDETRTWRSGTAHMVTGDPRFLISLDTNYDRVISSKGTKCITLAQTYSCRSSKGKGTGNRCNEDQPIFGESHDSSLGVGRWVPPEVLFLEDLQLHLGSFEIKLEYHGGSNVAGTWVILPKAKVVFVGDTVLVDQPPFLAYADLAVWEEDLKELASRAYKGYQIVSSRSGLVTQEQVRAMGRLIAYIHNLIKPLEESRAELDSFYQIIPKILKKFEVLPIYNELYYNRLRWGLTTWYEQHIQ